MSKWKSTKGKLKGDFRGTYERDRKGERIFVLSGQLSSGRKTKRITFESWQMAKKLGWKKVS